jgi:hypothetical protein
MFKKTVLDKFLFYFVTGSYISIGFAKTLKLQLERGFFSSLSCEKVNVNWYVKYILSYFPIGYFIMYYYRA